MGNDGDQKVNQRERKLKTLWPLDGEIFSIVLKNSQGICKAEIRRQLSKNVPNKTFYKSFRRLEKFGLIEIRKFGKMHLVFPSEEWNIVENSAKKFENWTKLAEIIWKSRLKKSPIEENATLMLNTYEMLLRFIVSDCIIGFLSRIYTENAKTWILERYIEVAEKILHSLKKCWNMVPKSQRETIMRKVQKTLKTASLVSEIFNLSQIENLEEMIEKQPLTSHEKKRVLKLMKALLKI